MVSSIMCKSIRAPLSSLFSFFPPTVLCANAPVGQQREALACLPYRLDLDFAIALHGLNPILDYSQRGNVSDKTQEQRMMGRIYITLTL